jgi:hypothetical protein
MRSSGASSEIEKDSREQFEAFRRWRCDAMSPGRASPGYENKPHEKSGVGFSSESRLRKVYCIRSAMQAGNMSTWH